MIEAIAHLGLLDDEEITLDTAALELSALDHHALDLAPYLGTLAAIEGDLGQFEDAADPVAQVEALVTVMSSIHGFAGDADSYDAPLNADMIRVLDRRKGLPIALSILYVALARRMGWAADILNVPGHVLVRIGPPAQALIIDPFSGGATVSRPQLLALVRRMLGPAVPIDRDHVAPMTNRQILVRLLRNQATRAEQENDVDRTRAINERIVTVAPADAQGWWDLARMQIAGGRPTDARVSLSAMLEITRDSEVRARIAAAMEAISAR